MIVMPALVAGIQGRLRQRFDMWLWIAGTSPAIRATDPVVKALRMYIADPGVFASYVQGRLERAQKSRDGSMRDEMRKVLRIPAIADQLGLTVEERKRLGENTN